MSGPSSNRKDPRENIGSQSTEAGSSSSVVNDARDAIIREKLVINGYSAEEINKIKEKVPELNFVFIEPQGGDSIRDTSADAVRLVKETGCPVVFKFNDALLIVNNGDTAESICEAYMAYCDEAQKKYWTPERLAAKEAREARHNALLADHIKELETLDFKDPVAPLKWLCRLEEVGGYTYSDYKRGEVVGAFLRAGYVPNMNVAKYYKAEDQENVKGYLIGQALSCIVSVGSPHQVIHEFTERYLKKFSLE